MKVLASPSPTNIDPSEWAQVYSELSTDPQSVGYKSAGQWKPYPEIARLLTTRPLVPNTADPMQVFVPLDKQDFLDLLLPSADVISDIAFTSLSDLIDDVNLGQDDKRADIVRWCDIMLARGWINQATYDNLVAIATDKIPDPNHPTEVPDNSPLERVLGRTAGISAKEVEDIIITGGG